MRVRSLARAPEQIRREGNLDFRADIYSLGATLFHALTGAPPFSGQTVQEIVRAHLNAPVPNPRERVLDISSGTAAIVVKMLAKDPGERYQSLESLDEDLDSVMAGRPPVNTITLGRKAIPLGEAGARAAGERRSASRVMAPVFAVVSLAILAGAAWFLFLRSKPEEPAAPVVPVEPVRPARDPGLDAAKVREARENQAAAALAGAEAFAGEHGGDSPEAVARFREVAEASPDTSAGRVALQKAADLEKARASS